MSMRCDLCVTDLLIWYSFLSLHIASRSPLPSDAGRHVAKTPVTPSLSLKTRTPAVVLIVSASVPPIPVKVIASTYDVWEKLFLNYIKDASILFAASQHV